MHPNGLLAGIVEDLKQVGGIKALVLGGSRARGTHNAKSDYDLGLYYDPAEPIDMNGLSEVAGRLDDDCRSSLVTSPGGWGPWINGGGWLRIQRQPVDLIYRDLAVVRRVLDECNHGRIEIYYQAGHPFGFISSIYLAELAICQPLWDPYNIVADLKQSAVPYPPPLKKALIEKFFWEADFSLKNGHKGLERFDVPYLSACCFRTTACLLQALFALNQQYWLNEKGALALAEQFTLKPECFSERINLVYKLLAVSPQQAQQALEGMCRLVAEVGQLIEQS